MSAYLKPSPWMPLSDSGDILLEVSVDKDIALRSGDQISREVGRSDVIQVAGDPGAGNAAVPVGVRLGTCRGGKQDAERTSNAAALKQIAYQPPDVQPPAAAL